MELAGCGVRTARGSFRTAQLLDETVVVQFSHMHNHAGSNGPAGRFGAPVAGAAFPLIQGLGP